MNSEEVIDCLDLKPHPEGGYYRETYRSEEVILKGALPERYGCNHAFGTAIYFMLTGESFSAFHRLTSDEIFHFHQGSPAVLTMISPKGELSRHILGNSLKDGERPQVVVPRGWWQALTVAKEGSDNFSLLGTTVAPGFDFADFQMAERTELLAHYPRHKEVITALTRS